MKAALHGGRTWWWRCGRLQGIAGKWGRSMGYVWACWLRLMNFIRQFTVEIWNMRFNESWRIPIRQISTSLENRGPLFLYESSCHPHVYLAYSVRTIDRRKILVHFLCKFRLLPQLPERIRTLFPEWPSCVPLMVLVIAEQLENERINNIVQEISILYLNHESARQMNPYLDGMFGIVEIIQSDYYSINV